MGDKKSPIRPKRQAKPAADDGYWDCSVCTFRNSAEAFKCSICDVRKGTSTRKPRINSQLVAQQVAQQYATPPPAKKEKKEKPERPEKERADGEQPERNLADGEQPERNLPGGEQPERNLPGGEQPERNLPGGEQPERNLPGGEQPERNLPGGEQPERNLPGGEQPERNLPDGEQPVKEKIETDQPEKEKKDGEKEITVARPKKPSKKTRPKVDNHHSPPSERNSIQSGKSTIKTKNSHISSRPKLKNVDRSTAQQLAITVGNVTVIITDFKEKTRSSSTSSSTVTSSAASEQQHPSSGSESMDKSSSRASTPKRDLSLGHDESF